MGNMSDDDMTAAGGEAPRSPAAPGVPMRERIVEAAAESFYAQGLRAVSAEKVIAQVGITKVTFLPGLAGQPGRKARGQAGPPPAGHAELGPGRNTAYRTAANRAARPRPGWRYAAASPPIMSSLLAAGPAAAWRTRAAARTA
jgi:hypothetical protein